jgi:hypothetical protein
LVVGLQSTQTPLPMQTFAQAALLCHWPVASQVCGTFPLQRVCPGGQTPMHVPTLQTNWHAVPFAHCPDVLQVCGVVPLHCLAPGMQTPQMPAPMHSDAHFA